MALHTRVRGRQISLVGLRDILLRWIVAGDAQVLGGHLQEVFIVTPMHVMTTEASFLQRRMATLPSELCVVVTTQTLPFHIFGEKKLFPGSVGIVATETLAILGGRVQVFLFQTQDGRIVTFLAKRRPRILQSQHPNESVRLMTRTAFLLGKWFVANRIIEILPLVAIETLSLGGKSASAFDLSRRSPGEHQ